MKKTIIISLLTLFVFFGCSGQSLDQDGIVRIKVDTDDDPFLGDPNAPVTIIAFEDFQCPFCQRFNWEVLPSLKKNYIDTGKVKFVFRDFPLTHLHPMAFKAAEAAECADEQGKFWEYHDILFEKQNFLSVENMKVWAANAGLNAEQFNDCLDSSKMAAEVRNDVEEGKSYGASSTPTVFVNGAMIAGLYPVSAYREVIDYELSR